MIVRTIVWALFIVAITPFDAAAQSGEYTDVPLPLLVKKFVRADQARSFDIGRTNNGQNILAAFDQERQLRVAVMRGSKGKIHRTKLELEATPRLRIADLNQDTRPDIIVCSERLRIYQVEDTELDLQWTSQEQFPDDPAPQIATSDLNGDGRLDIAVLSYVSEKDSDAPSLSLYFQQRESGTFVCGEAIRLTDREGYQSASAIAIGDFTGDGQTEIAVGNSNGTLWLLKKTNHRFKVAKRWTLKAGGAVGPGLAVGNVIGDQSEQLLVGTNGGNIFVYKFVTDGTPEVVATVMAGRMAYGVQAGDMDGDGRDEFLLARGHLGYANLTQKDVVVEIWKLTGDDQLENIWRKEANGFVRPELMLQDLNQDGKQDFIIYSPYGKGKPIEVTNPVLK